MTLDMTAAFQLTTWLPAIVMVALGIVLIALARRLRDGATHILLRQGLRMAGLALVVYGLFLAGTRLLSLDVTTFSHVSGRLLLIGLGTYVLWQGLDLLISLTVRELQQHIEEAEAEARIETLMTLGRWTGSVLILIVGIGMGLSVLNIDITPLIASAGIAGLAISLGAQQLVRDIIAGVLIIVEDQYHVGDVIEVAGKAGAVEHISLRATHVRDVDGTLHIVPHSAITTVSNRTSSWSRAVTEVGVGYDADLDHVVRVLQEVSGRLMEETEGFFVEEPAVQGPESFGDSAIGYRLLARVHAGVQWDAQRIMRRYIKEAFDTAGIDIPFPQRDVHIHTNTSLG